MQAIVSFKVSLQDVGEWRRYVLGSQEGHYVAILKYCLHIYTVILLLLQNKISFDMIIR